MVFLYFSVILEKMLNLKAKKFVILSFSFLVISNILAWITVFDLSRVRFLEVNFFNVGQGDAIFIETPKMGQILIDGGPGSIILEKLNKEMPFWDRTIDLIILTHPEHDHYAGLFEVLERYQVKNVLWTGVIRNTSEYNEWLKLVKKENAHVKIAEAGQRIVISNVTIDILYPFENLEGKVLENSNNTSIITKLNFREISFLFTGDVYKSIEKTLIEKGINLESDIFKIGHHGSKTSSAEDFLKKISPQIAIISVGEDNKYGHPHSEILENLVKFGIKTLRTDLDGDIKIISNGKNIKVIK